MTGSIRLSFLQIFDSEMLGKFIFYAFICVEVGWMAEKNMLFERTAFYYSSSLFLGSVSIFGPDI
jgi:hypothetical protein